MAARPLTFQGNEIAYLVGALTVMLEILPQGGDDVEMFGSLLDRSITALANPLAPDVAARIAKARTDKGLPA